MLENKDYCDYETSCTLYELGFTLDMTEKVYERNLMANRYETIPKPLLYEAQKWLREEKKIVVLVGFDFCPIISEIVYNWVIVVNGNSAKKSSYTYDYFEEALSECIKEAVKILKEDETIHR